MIRNMVRGDLERRRRFSKGLLPRIQARVKRGGNLGGGVGSH